MRVTTNIYRSANSILELFKFVTSLALVSAVSIWIGFNGMPRSMVNPFALEPTLVLVGFILLLVRYYHGNSLHLLDRYAEGTPARNIDVALPTDAFFILFQGIILAALSFSVRTMDLFGWLLLALLFVDAIWAGMLLRLNQEPTNSYLKSWFQINCAGALILIVVLVSTLSGGPRIVSICLFSFIAVHTFFDYWWNWRRYFPSPDDRRLMIGAPLTAKLVDGHWSDKELMDCIMRAHYICERSDYVVYSAHVIEQFGVKLRKVRNYVLADVREAKDAAVYIGITDGTQSNGMAVELGIAAASGTRILLFVRNETDQVFFSKS
jgi:hypothetical protein